MENTTVNRRKVRDLATLLKRATENLEIGLLTEQEPLPKELYSLGLHMMGQSWWFRDVHSTAMNTTRLRITDDEVRRELLNAIEKDVHPYVHDGRIQTAECSSINRKISQAGFPLEDILWNLVDNSLLHGSEKSAQTYYTQLNEEGMLCQHVTIVSGIFLEAESEVPLTDNIRLISLSGRKTDLPVCVPLSENRAQSDSGRYYSGRSAILEDVYIRPRFLNPTVTLADRLPVFLHNDTPWTRCDFLHKQLCDAISLASNCIVVPVRWGSFVKESELFRARILPIRSAWKNEHGQTSNSFVDPKDLNDTSSLLEGQRRLNEEERERMQSIVSWWKRAKLETDIVEAFRDLGVAMESLYLSGSRRDKIRFRISRNGAWHIGDTETEKAWLIEELKRIYDIRSTAVHEGRVTDEDAERLRKLGQDLCQRSMIKILKDGKFPDWENAVKAEK